MKNGRSDFRKGKFPPEWPLKHTFSLSASGAVHLTGSLALVSHLEGTSIVSVNPEILAFLSSDNLSSDNSTFLVARSLFVQGTVRSIHPNDR